MPLPTVLTPSVTARGGTVTAGFERGALIVQAADGKQLRLSWEAPGVTAKSPITLPDGEYSIRGYRVLATDSSGVPWVLSASGHSLGKFTVTHANNTQVAVDDTVRLVKKWTRSVVSVAVLGEGHTGLSIYRDGKRIPMGYRLLDSSGAVAAEGSMDYG